MIFEGATQEPPIIKWTCVCVFCGSYSEYGAMYCYVALFRGAINFNNFISASFVSILEICAHNGKLKPNEIETNKISSVGILM